MRVALVSFDFGEYCVRLAGGLAKYTQIRLLLPEHEFAPYRYILDSGVEVKTFVKPRLRQGLRQMRTIAGLVRELRRISPDVIHLQSGHLWFNCALPLLRQYPLVLTVHDPYKHLGDRGARNAPQWLLDFAAHRAARLIVHAPQLQKALVGRLPALSGRVRVIPHVMVGDDTAAPDVREDRNEILFFGRIWPYKGLDYLIRAEPLIAARVPDVKIVIAGEGEDFDRYRSMMTHPDRFVVYNRYIPDSERARLFRQAAVVVLPYIEATQSGVIPMAYRYGKPVVATTAGGLPASVDHERTGFLVPPRDCAALADALVTLLENDGLRHSLGTNAKCKVDTECAPEPIARQTMQVYREAVAAASY